MTAESELVRAAPYGRNGGARLPDDERIGFDSYAVMIAAVGGHRLHLAGSARDAIQTLSDHLRKLMVDRSPAALAAAVESPSDADMQTWVEPWRLSGPTVVLEDLATARTRLADAWRRQQLRQASTNACLEGPELGRVAPLDQETALILQRTIAAQGLSDLQASRAIRIARSIADLRAVSEIKKVDLVLALTHVPGTPRTGSF